MTLGQVHENRQNSVCELFDGVCSISLCLNTLFCNISDHHIEDLTVVLIYMYKLQSLQLLISYF